MENKVIIPVLQINDRKQEQMEKWESNAWKAVPFRGGSKPCLGRRNRRKQKKALSCEEPPYQFLNQPIRVC